MVFEQENFVCKASLKRKKNIGKFSCTSLARRNKWFSTQDNFYRMKLKACAEFY